MIRLNLPAEPYWLPLSCGLRLKCAPLDTSLLGAARARAVRRLQELTAQAEDLREAGARVDDLPDLTDPDRFAGHVKFLMAQSLADFGVLDWDTSQCQVLDAAGQPLAFDKTLLPQLMRHGTVAEDFLDKYTAPYEQLEAERNVSATAPGGTSGAVASTARGAARRTRRAAAASAAPTATSAPTSSTSP